MGTAAAQGRRTCSPLLPPRLDLDALDAHGPHAPALAAAQPCRCSDNEPSATASRELEPQRLACLPTAATWGGGGEVARTGDAMHSWRHAGNDVRVHYNMVLRSRADSEGAAPQGRHEKEPRTDVATLTSRAYASGSRADAPQTPTRRGGGERIPHRCGAGAAADGCHGVLSHTARLEAATPTGHDDPMLMTHAPRRLPQLAAGEGCAGAERGHSRSSSASSSRCRATALRSLAPLPPSETLPDARPSAARRSGSRVPVLRQGRAPGEAH